MVFHPEFGVGRYVYQTIPTWETACSMLQLEQHQLHTLVTNTVTQNQPAGECRNNGPDSFQQCHDNDRKREAVETVERKENDGSG